MDDDPPGPYRDRDGFGDIKVFPTLGSTARRRREGEAIGMSDEQLTFEQLQEQGWIIRWHSEIPSGHAYRLSMTLRDENGQAAHAAQGLGSTEEEAIAGAVAEANGWLQEQKRTGVIPPDR